MKSTPRFILLDDDLCALTITTQIIRNFDGLAEVIVFSDCKAAIQYMEAGGFSANDQDTVVLTDLHMPESDGFTLLDRMEAIFMATRPRLRVFVLSAEACPAEIKKVLSYRFVTGFLDKPFSTAKFQDILKCTQYPL